MEDGQATWLLWMVIGAFLLGLVVMWVDDDYRFDSIKKSNEKFFPAVEVKAP